MRTLILSMVVAAGLASLVMAGEFHEAVTAGDAARVKEMLRQDPDLVSLPDENDQFLAPPLCLAAIAGDIEMARILLDAGADVDLGDVDESTPLHVAALNRHPEMVTFLLEKGADINRRDKNGGYALSFAASGGDPAVVQTLLDAGADLNFSSPQGYNLYHLTASRNLRNLTDILLARGDDINQASQDGTAPLHWAALRDQAEMITYMIDNGAEHSPADEHGVTPLALAAQRNAAEAAAALIAAGADPNAGDNTRITPLHRASWSGNLEVAEVLLGHGADPNAEDENGMTPLTRAVPQGNVELVNALLAAGADVNTVDGRLGCSALHMASLLGYADISEVLIQAGASTGEKDERGNCPFDYAARYGHEDVARVLKDHGVRGKMPAVPEGALAAQGDVAQGEAVIWYLGHSGWAIKTLNNFLIFDYFNRDRDPAAPALCNGRINCEEIAGENVTVFVSHEHGDHFDPLISVSYTHLTLPTN